MVSWGGCRLSTGGSLPPLKGVVKISLILTMIIASVSTARGRATDAMI